jgi:ectoine hydroxylase-related dioxygenase (phytanoyl-CoA dioxygenase family)
MYPGFLEMSMTASSPSHSVIDPATLAARQAAADFARDGFYIVPTPVLPADLIARVIPRMEAVMNGEYETGVPPQSRCWKPGDSPTAIRKIDDAHLSDRTILELVSHPALGRWAAAITGAQRVQVWATQLLYKPPASTFTGNVGWHQDYQYWTYWEPDSEVFTVWVAVGEVPVERGPMRFVRGSHQWGLLSGGDFFGQDLDAQRQVLKSAGPGATWEEVSGALSSGGVSFHHRLTIHGSGPNTSDQPRRSFAIHLRTERSRPVSGSKAMYVARLDDPIACPVIFG